MTFIAGRAPSDTPPDWHLLPPSFTSLSTFEDGGSRVQLYRTEDCDVLRFSRLADFYLQPRRIFGCPAGGADSSLLELRLLGPVMALWLETRGIVALHASAVAVGEQVCAFLAGRRGGKSSLAAALVEGGLSLLTDDLLAVEARGRGFVGRPAYPEMRMWPETARFFVGGIERLPVLHPSVDKRRVVVDRGGFGRFQSTAAELGCIYLTERRAGDPRIEPLAPGEALIELVGHSYVPNLVEGMGLARQRLDFFSRLLRRIPVRRLLYPEGFEHLSRVRDAVLADLGGP